MDPENGIHIYFFPFFFIITVGYILRWIYVFTKSVFKLIRNQNKRTKEKEKQSRSAFTPFVINNLELKELSARENFKVVHKELID